MGQSEVLLRTNWGTHWEQQQNPTPSTLPTRRKLSPLVARWLISLAYDFYHFWPRLTAGPQFWGHNNVMTYNCNLLLSHLFSTTI
jgi:hypothetical protein